MGKPAVELLGRGEMEMDEQCRLDVALVRRRLLPSRERAAAAVRAGLVRVNGQTAAKPSQTVGPTDQIEVLADPVGYVSRGALKLQAALDHWQIDPAGLVCLDIGASTGGFTQLLLERGARRVYAVDVGRDQLHPELRADPRVVSLEQTDIRTLPALPGEPPALAAVDVSFISLTLILPHLVRLAPGAAVVALVKPQFEVGPGGVGKKGVVRDTRLHAQAVDRVLLAARAAGLHPAGPAIDSPIPGGEGNREFLLYLLPE